MHTPGRPPPCPQPVPPPSPQQTPAGHSTHPHISRWNHARNHLTTFPLRWFPRRRLVKWRTRRLRGNVLAVSAQSELPGGGSVCGMCGRFNLITCPDVGTLPTVGPTVVISIAFWHRSCCVQVGSMAPLNAWTAGFAAAPRRTIVTIFRAGLPGRRREATRGLPTAPESSGRRATASCSSTKRKWIRRSVVVYRTSGSNPALRQVATAHIPAGELTGSRTKGVRFELADGLFGPGGGGHEQERIGE